MAFPDITPVVARYKLRAFGVLRKDTGRVVLPDPSDADWQDYQQRLQMGEQPDPVDAAPAPTAEEISAKAEESARETIRGELRLDAAIQALRTRTPAQVDAWIEANVTTLAEARAVLKILARILALIARERLG